MVFGCPWHSICYTVHTIQYILNCKKKENWELRLKAFKVSATFFPQSWHPPPPLQPPHHKNPPTSSDLLRKLYRRSRTDRRPQPHPATQAQLLRTISCCQQFFHNLFTFLFQLYYYIIIILPSKSHKVNRRAGNTSLCSSTWFPYIHIISEKRWGCRSSTTWKVAIAQCWWV